MSSPNSAPVTIVSIPVKQITVHTDGACEGNPGPGGWAAILQYGAQTREIAGGEPVTTNNRMELQAAIAALRALREPCAVEVFSDSQYLRQGVTEWIARWKANGWRTIKREPVKNADLWRELDALAGMHRVRWRWLKGHAGHALNERCDQLAGAEIARLRKAFTRDQLAAKLAVFQAAAEPAAKQLGLMDGPPAGARRATG